MEKAWIIVSNSTKYGLKHPTEMFEESSNQEITWGIPKTSLSDLQKDDIIYLYSSPEKALILKAKVIEVNREDKEDMYFSMQLIEKLEPQIPLQFLIEKGIVKEKDRMQNCREISADDVEKIQKIK